MSISANRMRSHHETCSSEIRNFNELLQSAVPEPSVAESFVTAREQLEQSFETANEELEESFPSVADPQDISYDPASDAANISSDLNTSNNYDLYGQQQNAYLWYVISIILVSHQFYKKS